MSTVCLRYLYLYLCLYKVNLGICFGVPNNEQLVKL